MSNALMMMAYGAYFMDGGDYSPNLIPEPYFTEDSNWNSVSSGSTETHGQVDESGGNKAVLITFVGSTNHQTWYDLLDSEGNPDPLVEGKAYVLKSYMKAGPDGFTNPMDFAYYTGSDSINEKEITIDDTWKQYEMRFIAREDYNNDPSIRLIGYSNGLDGEGVYQGETRLEEMQVSGDGSPIIVDNTISNSSAYWNFTSDMTVTEGVTADSETATRVELLNANGHHVEYALDSPLPAGEAFTLSIRAKAGPNGFPDNFQLAYYDDGSEVQGIEIALTSTWETYHFKFIAQEASNVGPAIRLIGYSNGSAGDQVDIQSVHLVEGTDPAI